MRSLKIKCPDCKHRFDIERNEYDAGDFLSCPECNLELTIELNDTGKMRVKTAKEKELEDEEAFDEFYEED